MSSTKYCALCVLAAKSVWTVMSEAEEKAIIPLCSEHAPQIERLFNLCKVDGESQPGPKRRRADPERDEERYKKAFQPLDWEPPTN